MVHLAKRNSDRCPTHHGALLREDVIPATGKTKTEIAQLLGISRQHLYDILRERKRVSPAVAVRLGKLFGDGAGVWIRMQAAYDTWATERAKRLCHLSPPENLFAASNRGRNPDGWSDSVRASRPSWAASGQKKVRPSKTEPT
jgi:antitoxin HigA-1